jgi:hypothetical protein
MVGESFAQYGFARKVLARATTAYRLAQVDFCARCLQRTFFGLLLHVCHYRTVDLNASLRPAACFSGLLLSGDTSSV